MVRQHEVRTLTEERSSQTLHLTQLLSKHDCPENPAGEHQNNLAEPRQPTVRSLQIFQVIKGRNDFLYSKRSQIDTQHVASLNDDWKKILEQFSCVKTAPSRRDALEKPVINLLQVFLGSVWCHRTPPCLGNCEQVSTQPRQTTGNRQKK